MYLHKLKSLNIGQKIFQLLDFLFFCITYIEPLNNSHADILLRMNGKDNLIDGDCKKTIFDTNYIL